MRAVGLLLALPHGMRPAQTIARSPTDTAGIALVEALVAIALLASALVALAGILTTAASATYRAHLVSNAAVLASRKMEQLRSLAWGTDVAGGFVSDLSTDTAAIEQAAPCRAVPPSQGVGLSVSPAGALDADTAGYVDFVDEFGCVVAADDHAPPGGIYLRRWSVTPLPVAPDTALVLQVVVARYEQTMARIGVVRGRPGSAWLVSIKSRKRL